MHRGEAHPPHLLQTLSVWERCASLLCVQAARTLTLSYQGFILVKPCDSDPQILVTHCNHIAFTAPCLDKVYLISYFFTAIPFHLSFIYILATVVPPAALLPLLCSLN